MAANKLRTAILGLDKGGISLLQAASSVDSFEVQAVARC